MSVVLAPEGAASAGVAARLRALARVRPIAAGGTMLVAAGLFVPAAPLRLAVDDSPALGVRLAVPAAYVAFSPFTRLADALCLMSTAQHGAVVATLLVVAAAWKVARRCPHASALRTCARASGACALSLVAFVVLLAGAVFTPRPMASLVTADPDELRVDFHTHTSASHDVPAWFTPARRREWHTAAGYDLAYVSDHRAIAGAVEAARANPARAGDGLVVRPAVEAWWQGIHVIVLGPVALDPAFLADEHADRALAVAARPAGAPPPVGLAAIPDDVLGAVTPAALATAPWLRGIEIADGAPRAIAQRDREGDAIVARAATLGVLPVAATNHHGWGRTAVAWNLVRVPGWRSMSPDTLGARVEDVLRRGDARDVRVVARARAEVAAAGAARVASLVLTLPAVLWQAAAELQPGERLVWLACLWAPAALAAALRRNERRRAAARAA